MKINVDSIARTVEIDNRIPLRHYYRIADNLLKQASIYREENNVVDLYIILLRYSSLVSETIPFHRDYQVMLPKERTKYRKSLLAVLDELESLKPEFQRRVDELNNDHSGAGLPQLDGLESTSFGSETHSLEWPAVNRNSYLSVNNKRPASIAPQSSWKYDTDHSQVLSSNSMQIDKQFQKFVNSLNQAGQYDLVAAKDGDPGGVRSEMDSVLSLDDGRWPRLAEESCSSLINEAREDAFQLVKQPSIPPVLAQLQQDFTPIPPSKVADPRPGPAKSSQDGMPSSDSYQHLHVPVKMLEDFLRLAQANTTKNLETCGVLAGSLKNRVFHITTLIIPKQESTSDSV
uniref:USP8 dimerisation domain-containing protein n=1 Tax=Fagus sylvatica TaxID=28930 RepID=A0A2N9F025_FAGSY